MMLIRFLVPSLEYLYKFSPKIAIALRDRMDKDLAWDQEVNIFLKLNGIAECCLNFWNSCKITITFFTAPIDKCHHRHNVKLDAEARGTTTFPFIICLHWRGWGWKKCFVSNIFPILRSPPKSGKHF